VASIITLQQIPNQALSVQVDGNFYEIRITAGKSTMNVDMYRNNALIISGFRIVAGSLFIAYRYLEAGNFFIQTVNQEIPYYPKFGSTQKLIYIPQVELNSIRARFQNDLI